MTIPGASRPFPIAPSAARRRCRAVPRALLESFSYGYDAAGNRLTSSVNGTQVASYSYDDADQLVSDGTTSYTYDDAGNLTAAGSDSYSWDWADRLTSATVSSVTTDYVWDRIGTLLVVVDDGTNAYLHADGLLAQIDGNDDALYALTDALGSVRGLADESGSLVGTADYSAFGEVRGTSGTTSVFGYTGEQQDATTGLTYLRARYLAPSLGRFVSMDTVQPNAPGTQGYNRCAYVANNPATWTDPSGHSAASTLCALVFGGAVQTALRLWAAAHGILVGVHKRGAYVIAISAAFVAAGAASEALLGDTNYVRAGETLGAGLLLGNGLALSVWAGGTPHMSIVVALSLLLAGVLLLLVGTIMQALAEIVDFAAGLWRTYSPAALACRNWTQSPWSLGDLPSIRGSQSPDGQDRDGLVDAWRSVPRLPAGT